MFNENDDQASYKHTWRNDSKDCEKRIKRLQKDLEDAEKNFKRVNDLYGDSVTESMEKGKKIRELEGQVEDLEDKLEQCKKEKQELEDKLKDCQEGRKDLEDKLEQCKKEKQELEDKLKDCQEGRKELEDKLEQCKKEKQELEDKLKECQEDKKDLEDKLKDCQEGRKELEDKLEQCKKEKQELEDKLKDCQEGRKELEDKLEQCKKEKQELEDKLKECQEGKKDLEQCKKEKQELEDKLKECKEKCDDAGDDDLVISDDKEVAKFIMEVLDKAIPHSARIKNCRDGKHIINKDEEISDLMPSTLLLQRKEKDGLVLKIMQEVLMTNFWNGNATTYGLYSAWAMNTLDYSYKGNWGVNYRLFPKTMVKNHDNDSIIWSGMLFHSKNELYFDKIFEIIEQYLQKHGVNCTVEKKFNPSHGRIWGTQKVIVSHGSLPFPKAKIKGASANSPYYYLQVNFDIKMKSSKKTYPIRGYTMLLTDALDLYKIGNTNTEDKKDNDYEDIMDEFN